MTDQSAPDQEMPPQPGRAPSAAEMAAGLKAKQAAAAADGGLGPTETDIEALVAQMQQQMAAMAAQIQQMQAAAGPRGQHPLIATAANLRYHLRDAEGSDAHAPGIALADDLIEAAGNAVESGDLTHVRSILDRLTRFFRRLPARPGDDHHGRQAREIIADHLPDQLDAFIPSPKHPGLGSSRAPVPVVAGSVVAG
jgi:hypothetical protein